MAMNFDEICNLKKGDIVWEKWLRVELTSDPVVVSTNILDTVYTQVSFKAKVGGGETAYLFTKELMEYAPQLYPEKMYESSFS